MSLLSHRVVRTRLSKLEIKKYRNTKYFSKILKDNECEKIEKVMEQKIFLNKKVNKNKNIKQKKILKKENITERIEERKPAYRAKLCRFFLFNSCTRGDSCTYSHDTFKFPCKSFHLKKMCNRVRCVFSHDDLTESELIRLKQEENIEEPVQFYSPFSDNHLS